MFLVGHIMPGITMARPPAGFLKILAHTKAHKVMDHWKEIHISLEETVLYAEMQQKVLAVFQRN